MPARADDDFAAAKGPTKLAGWTWNEQRKKLLWEALTKVQQVGSQLSRVWGCLCQNLCHHPCQVIQQT